MKLLIISDAWHPQVNGVVRTYEHLGAELVRRGHEVRVVGPSDFKMSFPMPGYAEIRLVPFAYGALKRMIEDYQPDAIHIPTEGPLGRAGQRYCKRHERIFTTAYHTHFPDYFAKRVAKYLKFLYKPAHSIGKSYIKKFHTPSGGMMVATQSLEDQLRDWDFQVPMHRITRGVKMDVFYPGDSNVLQDVKKPIALYVGRVAIEKNIEAFMEMEWDGTKVIVGDGPSRSALEARYPDAIFAGIQTGDDLAAYYRAADIFVFPSKTDTFGIVLVEALASGLPIAGFRVTGPQDIVTEEYLGCLSDSDDGLGQAAQEALRRGNSDICVEFIQRHYTWDTAGGQFEAAILKTLGRKV